MPQWCTDDGRRGPRQVQAAPPTFIISLSSTDVFSDDRSWETRLCWPQIMTKGEMNGTRCTLDPQVDLSHVLQNSPSTLCPAVCGCSLVIHESKKNVNGFRSGFFWFRMQEWKYYFLYWLKSVAIHLKYGLLLRLVSQFRSEHIDPYSQPWVSFQIVCSQNENVCLYIFFCIQNWLKR